MSATSPDSHLHRIARGSALSLAGNLVAGLSTFALTLVVTRGWDGETAGTFFAATSLFLIVSASALLGADTGLARFTLRYEELGRGDEVPVLVRAALRPVVICSLVVGVVVFAAADPLSQLCGLAEESGPNLVRVLAFALPAATLSDGLLAVSRARGAMRPTVLIDRLMRSGGQPVCVVAALALGGGLVTLAAAWAVPYVVALGTAVLVVRRTGRGLSHPPPTAAAAAAAARPTVSAEFWRYTWWRGVARVFQVALQRLDIVLVAALRSPTEAALYTAATRFVVLGQLGVQAIQQVLQPQLTRLLTAGDAAQTQHVFRIATAWTMALSWPVYLVAAAAAPLYLSLFGPSYVELGQVVVVTMAAAMLMATAAGSVDVVLLMAGRSALSLGNNVLALVVNVGLGLAFIPAYGINAAALAWAVALVVRNALPFWQVRRDLGLTGLGRPAALVAAASVACFVGPLSAVRAVTDLTVVSGVAAVALGSVAYLSVLWRLREPLHLSVLLAAARRRGGTPAAPSRP